MDTQSMAPAAEQPETSGGAAPEGKEKGFFHITLLVEKGVCIISLVLLTLIAASESIARLFGTGVPASNGLLTHFLLVAGLFSGMFATKSGEHLSIALVHYVKNEKYRTVFAAITGFFSVFISVILTWASVSFIRNGIPVRLIGFIPNVVFAAAMPLGYAVMAWRFAYQTPVRGKGRILPILAGLLGCIVSFPVIAKIIWGMDVPDLIYSASDFLNAGIYLFRLPLIILFILIAFMGAPIFTVLAGITLVSILGGGGEAEAVTNSIFTALTDNSIIAIPLFTLTGFFLSESKAGHRLVNTFRALFSWMPGGVIIATVIICAFFTSFTGASGVTILALGGILYTVLTEKKVYSERFSIGLLTSAGAIGLLFPPSLPIILAGATTKTNIIHMFLGAFFPGLILVAAMIIAAFLVSKKNKIPLEPFKAATAGKALKESALEILLPVILIVGYFSGLFSLVEIGAISVVYVFIAEVLVYREIKFNAIKTVFLKSLPIIGGILSIIAAAKALSYAIVDTQLPENLAHWMQAVVQSRFMFLLLLNIALLVVGCLMDIFSAILVVLPLVAPLGVVYGIDPVHLGVIFLMNLEVGFLTPPVGLNLFLASYRFGKPFMEITRYVLPFLLMQLAVVLLVTYIPALSTWLPGLLK
ncbi:MAG: TRAP transporter large permease [Treponema sp.]|nr:TRAP transporter large permease [Treponema sp.]